MIGEKGMTVTQTIKVFIHTYQSDRPPKCGYCTIPFRNNQHTHQIPSDLMGDDCSAYWHVCTNCKNQIFYEINHDLPCEGPDGKKYRSCRLKKRAMS